MECELRKNNQIHAPQSSSPLHFRLLLSALLLALLAGSACSSDKADTDEEPAVRTLRFWHFWSEPSHKSALQNVIAGFEREHNCRVELTDLSWNDGKTKLFAAFSSGTAPDVVELGSDWVAQFAGAGVLQNLSESSVALDNFLDFAHPPALHEGQVYALPWVVDTRVMYYNKALLAKAGWKDSVPATLPELLAACDAIQQLDDVYGFGANGPDPNRLYKKVLPFYWMQGGGVFDSTGAPSLNSPANIAALDQYLQLAAKGYVETQRQLDNAFIQGKVGFWISGSWLLDRIAKENPQLEYSTMLIPAPEGGQSASFAGGEYLALSAGSDKKDLALTFARWLTEGRQALAFCQQVAAAGFPADKDFFRHKYFETIPHKMSFAQQLQFARMTPVHQQWLDIQSIIEESAVEALYGTKSAEESLNDAQDAAVQLLGDGES